MSLPSRQRPKAVRPAATAWSRVARGGTARQLCGTLCLVLATALASVHSAPPPGPAPAMDRDLMASFLYNFTVFVRWPDWAFDGPDAPFVIAVLGDDPLGDRLEATVRDKDVRGRKLVVRRVEPGAAAGPCQILFIGQSERTRLEPILGTVRDRPILTVSDFERFAAQGGIIAVSKPQTRIQFAVNLESARQAKLTLSARLLSMKNVHILSSTEAKP